MINDENYSQTKRGRDWIKSLLESGNLTDEHRKYWEYGLVITDAMLDLQALPEDASEEERQAKITLVADLQRKGVELGFLVPGGVTKEKSTEELRKLLHRTN